MGLWLWRVNIPSTHWCFFLADLDGASQVKGPVMSIKTGLRSLKPYLYVDNRSLYLRCINEGANRSEIDVASKHGLRMDSKLKILSSRKPPSRPMTAKRSLLPQLATVALLLVFRRRRLSPRQSTRPRNTDKNINKGGRSGGSLR